MMEPSKSGALGPGGYLNDDGPPTAQAMEEARVVAQQPSNVGGDGAPTTNMAASSAEPQGAATGTPGMMPPGPGAADYQPPVGQWKDHMFNCFSQTSPSCLVSCFLPCCALAMLSKRVGYASYNTIFFILLGLAVIGSIFGPLLFYSLAVLVITVHLLLLVRAKYQLPALVGEKKDGCLAVTFDVLSVCFCTPCVISQMLRHTFNYTQQCDECNVMDDRVATLV